MNERGEMSSVLATLSDGSLVMSVVIDDLPLARHLYRVVRPDGAVISEHAALTGVTDFLDEYDADVLGPVGDRGPWGGGLRTWF